MIRNNLNLNQLLQSAENIVVQLSPTSAMSFTELLRTRVPAWTILLAIFVASTIVVVGDLSVMVMTAIQSGPIEGQASTTARSVPWAAILIAAACAGGTAYAFLVVKAAKKGAWQTSRVLSADEIAEARWLLGSETAKVADLFESSAHTHENYASSLEAVRSKIESIKTPDQLRDIASRLVVENLRMQRETQKMAKSLEASRSQIESLHFSLQQARAEVQRDSLTAISNRRGFEEALTRAVQKASTAKTELSIVMLDIDNFKQVNDKYGHSGGDAVLKAFAQLLDKSLRGHDTVARFGGEEFALILPGAGILPASILAERLRTRIEAERFDVGGGRHIQITASMGVAERRTGEVEADLVNRADSRLYRAKHLGRNRVVTT